jgi:hypothetical protein
MPMSISIAGCSVFVSAACAADENQYYYTPGTPGV